MERVEYLVEQIKKNGWKRGAEIGVFQGQTLFALMDKCPELKMYAVDPWIVREGFGRREDTGFASYSKAHINRMVEQVGVQTIVDSAKYKGRVTVLAVDSLLGAECVPNRKLDFVIIDGDHREAHVRADIAAWMPKLRDNGMLYGHDWNTFGSVKKAVKGMLKTFEVNEDINFWMTPKVEYGKC